MTHKAKPTKRLSALVLALALALPGAASGLHAMEVLSAADLAGYCLAGAERGAAPGERCATYVHGFVDGAVATDPQVTLNVTREMESVEEFTQRALLERIGARIERFGPSVYADFCVPQPAPLSEITGYVIELLRAVENSEEPARDVVYRALRAHYPCA